MIPSKELRIEDLADATRKGWGLSNQKCPDVVTMLYKLKHDGLILGYELLSERELPDEEAQFDPHRKILSVRHSVFEAANDLYSGPKKARARFTLAHEFGHIILRHKRVRHRSISDKKIERIVIQTRVDEAEADRFAGAILVPRHLVDLSSHYSAEQLAMEFQVSLPAATIRIEELQRMWRRAHGIQRELPASIREVLQELKSGGKKA